MLSTLLCLQVVTHRVMIIHLCLDLCKTPLLKATAIRLSRAALFLDPWTVHTPLLIPGPAPILLVMDCLFMGLPPITQAMGRLFLGLAPTPRALARLLLGLTSIHSAIARLFLGLAPMRPVLNRLFMGLAPLPQSINCTFPEPRIWTTCLATFLLFMTQWIRTPLLDATRMFLAYPTTATTATATPGLVTHGNYEEDFSDN